ncbi:MAG: fused MFS/spermidine synthase, partial [Acidobacteriota bacterium]|nr:fused MFS/spermidine synthase [Acidobacteriota bacterium]
DTKKPIRVIATDPHYIQSAIFLDSDELVLKYAPFYHLIAHFKPDFQKTLLIGGAGYTFPRDYLQKYPNAEIEVVEIDPQMTAIARKFFRLQDDPRLKITHDDGRIFLNNAESARYDTVLMDAFGSLFSVPYHLTTLESVRQIHRVLKDDGVVIFNLGGAISGSGSRFLQAELKTYKQVFPRVYLFKVNPANTDGRFQNLIIVALKEKNASDLQSSDAPTAELLSHLYNQPIPSEIQILTDDLAPVEYYNSFAQSLYQSKKPTKK